AACSDDNPSDSDTMDTTELPDGNDVVDPCMGIDECAAPRSACDGGTLVECVFGMDGCLDEVRTNCGEDGRVCTATATRASCQPDPSVCNSLPNACALLGRSCNG